jgi:vanadium-dependent haloperoxidase-like protein
MIAEYWADGPASELPPGHWNLLAQAVARRDRHSLDENVKLFFLLNNALFDASVAVWESKVFFDYVRPITAIRFLFAGQAVEAWGGPFQGTQTIDGKDWLPYQRGTFLTPPFAEYVSGHSTFSGASAEILRRFTGSDVFRHGVVLTAGSSRIEPGLTPRHPIVLYWPTFSAAAEQAGLSRRYGGIHFRDGDLEGRAMGRRVGAAVWQKAQRLFAGSHSPSMH